MEIAAERALADILQREKLPMLSEWETQAKNLPGTRQPCSPVLRDHFPILIDELTNALAGRKMASPASASPPTANQLDIGLNLEQVFEEYRLLRQCIVQHIERLGLSVTREANAVLDVLIDNGIRAAIKAYIERRDETERGQREEYLTFIVHDLRAPLTAIYNAILLLEYDLKGSSISERARAIPAAVKRNIERMQSLMLKLLHTEGGRDDAKPALRRPPVDLKETVDAIARSLAPSAAAYGTQVVNCIAAGTIIYADTELLERIFQNLIHNAIAYTPGGTITISATHLSDGGIECRVDDTGRGIPDNLKPKLFEKYMSDRKQAGGIGLGLSIVKRLIELHGGSIKIESHVGVGTTVVFSIPGISTNL